ncbi:trace amine-associated receptor 13c-like [Oncorhynchus mykiss]|uniref:trace amine-associated receptor 13c-like n=1 Tax=Oncorhynchus mykiss TaxID=8022 RepID=UPI001877A1D7|nr:trace amine-associated receptor 13c-like [Oncorhynchus mykiss]XP_036831345.1 trace amine-associated receptor 13c-like [Oncorhynchus mykiss]
MVLQLSPRVQTSPGQRGAREKINPAVIGAVRRKGSVPGLAEHLSEDPGTPREWRRGLEPPPRAPEDVLHLLQTMGMAEQTPAHDSTRRTVDEWNVLLTTAQLYLVAWCWETVPLPFSVTLEEGRKSLGAFGHVTVENFQDGSKQSPIDVDGQSDDGAKIRGKALLSTSIYIALYIFFSVISAVTVFLNILVIISISHFKPLHTTTNLLILSLAVSDLLVGLIVIPVMTVAVMESCWGFGGHFCVFQFYITFLCTSLSLGNLVLISIDRYVAVCDPLLYHSKITTTRIMCCISITWCCCIIYSAANIPYFVNVQVPSRCLKECTTVEGSIWVNITDLVITMVVPCSVIIVLYVKIFVVARSQARKVFSKEAASVSGVKTVQANKSERKAAKTLAIVVFNYLICWIPSLFIFLFFLF